MPKCTQPHNERNVITMSRAKMLQAGIAESTLSLLEPFGGMFYGGNLSQDDDFRWAARKPLPVAAMCLTKWGLNVSKDFDVEIVFGYPGRGRRPLLVPKLAFLLLPHEITTVLTALRDLPMPATRTPGLIPDWLVYENDLAVFTQFCKRLMKGENLERLEQTLVQMRHEKLLYWSLIARLDSMAKGVPGLEEWLKSVAAKRAAV